MLYPDVTWGKKSLPLPAGYATAHAPRVLLTFVAARVPSSLMFSLSSAKTFAAELVSSHLDPILYPCLGLSIPSTELCICLRQNPWGSCWPGPPGCRADQRRRCWSPNPNPSCGTGASLNTASQCDKSLYWLFSQTWSYFFVSDSSFSQHNRVW